MTLALVSAQNAGKRSRARLKCGKQGGTIAAAGVGRVKRNVQVDLVRFEPVDAPRLAFPAAVLTVFLFLRRQPSVMRSRVRVQDCRGIWQLDRQAVPCCTRV